MKDILMMLKEIVVTKAEIAKQEAAMLQNLSRALDVLIYNEQKLKDEPMVVPVTFVQQASPSRYLNVRQASKYLGISKSTLYEMRKNGILNYVRVGKRMARYKIEDLDALALKPGASTTSSTLHKDQGL